MAKKICIDAGHYGRYNRSPVVPEYYESDMVWKLHLMQKEILEGYGFEVILTRDSQAGDRGLYNRGYAAKGCVLFISDHSNACGTERVDYPVVYRGYDNIGNCDMLALKLAKVIASTMGTVQAGRTATRKGSSGGEYYGVLRGARAAGLTDYYILEHSFHTNLRMTRWLLSDANLRKLAEEECRVIAEHYGMITGGTGTEKAEENRPADDRSKTEAARSFNRSLAGRYIVSTSADPLLLRAGAGSTKPVIARMPKGAMVQCYGYYTDAGGERWYYVCYKGMTGYASGKFLKKRGG